MVKFQPFYCKINHKKIQCFNLIRLQLKKKIIVEMFILPFHPHPPEYFTVKWTKMDLVPVIALNFMGSKFFLYFSGLNREGSVASWIRYWIPS